MNLYNLDKDTLITVIETLDTALSAALEKLRCAEWRNGNDSATIAELRATIAETTRRSLEEFRAGIGDDTRSRLDKLFTEDPRHNKIAMIKLLRDVTGTGLRESKEAIEAWYEFPPYNPEVY